VNLAGRTTAGRAAPGPAVANLLNPVPAQRARLLAQGDVAAAARWAKERGLAAEDKPGYTREPEYLVLVAQNHPGPAPGLLDRLHAAATAQGRAGSVIEIQVLRALALAASGDQAAAAGALAGAFTLACPQGYVRVVADEGAPMGVLLGRLARVLQALSQSTPRRGPAEKPRRCRAWSSS
jgi:tetratricopeptide repeat protein